MEPISAILTTTLGFIVKAASESETFKMAKEELLGGFWRWIKPKFIKDIPEIESDSETEETQIKTEEKLFELIKDEEFFNELVKRVVDLQKAGIKEKNIVRKSIINVKKIHVGDKVYNPDDIYDYKNIIGENVEGADEFILGDGH